MTADGSSVSLQALRADTGAPLDAVQFAHTDGQLEAQQQTHVWFAAGVAVLAAGVLWFVYQSVAGRCTPGSAD